MNDSTRLIIFVVLASAILFTFNLFYGPKPRPAVANPPPSANGVNAAGAASGAAPRAAATSSSALDNELPPASISAADVKNYTLENSLVSMAFSNIGASLSSCRLKKYSDAKDKKETLELIPSRDTFSYMSLNFGDGKENAAWSMAGIKRSTGASTITFTRQLKDGLTAVKEFTLKDDSYELDIKITVINKGASAVALKDAQFSWGPNIHYLPGDLAKMKSGVSGSFNKIVYASEKLLKTETINLKANETKISVLGVIPDWMAMKDLYFLSIIKPALKADIKSAAIKQGRGGFSYIILNLRDMLVNPRSRETIEINTYVGPGEYKRLKALGMDNAVDMGGIRFLGVWMFYALDFFFKLTKNYGVAILLLTIIIRVLLWIPSNSSFKQMKETQSKMAILKPRLETMKKIYKDDAKKLNEETMKLYQEYKINPFGGCLPILLQLPIFIALYATLINMVELKGANFALWWNDLSSPDPFYVLPVFMGITMLIQQKMSQPPSMGTEQDSSQKLLLYGMPIFLTFMAFSWPSGLMLYWGISNILGILQQVLVNKTK